MGIITVSPARSSARRVAVVAGTLLAVLPALCSSVLAVPSAHAMHGVAMAVTSQVGTVGAASVPVECVSHACCKVPARQAAREDTAGPVAASTAVALEAPAAVLQLTSGIRAAAHPALQRSPAPPGTVPGALPVLC